MKQSFLLILFITQCFFASAQQSLSLEQYLAIVKRHHPVARQAGIGVEIAKAEVTAARGAFDPTFENTIARKELEDLLYYDHQISEVTVPTWYGLNVVAGVESLSGQCTSDPDTKGNSSYFGLSLPIAKGLLMDRRRADLQQAKIFQQLSVQEQQTIINNLLFDAAGAYWGWWQQYQTQVLFQQAVKNAAQRFRLVKTAFQMGERPAIDTVEALVQVQSIQLSANQLLLDATNTQLGVNVFLWQQNGDAYTLPQNIIPLAPKAGFLEAMQIDKLLQAAALHPELQQYRFKLDALAVEKGLKFQSLLPSVYLKYNQLNKSHDLRKSFSTPWLQNNYRYGVSVSVPLRLSQGRGQYRQAKLKIEQTQLEQLAKQASLQTKLQQYYNEWTQIKQQVVLQQQAVQSYAALQRGEALKFSTGESSLFFVNARELKTLEAQAKLIELQAKEQKAIAGALWAAGVLANQ